MKQAIYQRLCDLVYEESGIRIRPGKEAMVSARLSKRIREVGLRTEAEYLDYLEGDRKTEVVHLLDLISTNVTHFFREDEHFDFVAETFKRWLGEGQKRFRFWCAAASTGEEPYSLALTLRDTADQLGHRPDFRVLATDISTRVLSHAEKGCYPDKSLDNVPATYRKRFFNRNGNNSQPGWSVADEIRRTVLFRRLNLSTPPFPMSGPIDVVFCRNVMFYFDDPIKNALISDIHRMLRPGGYLITGKSESIPALRSRDQFVSVGPAIFQKVA